MKKTLEEWKTEYVTKERIDEMMTQRNITEEEAVEILNQTVEDTYNICNLQPMTAPTGETFKLKEPINYFDEIIKKYNRLKEVESKYIELIYHVETKFPMETRHETALRYIKNAEKTNSNPAQCSPQSHSS